MRLPEGVHPLNAEERIDKLYAWSMTLKMKIFDITFITIYIAVNDVLSNIRRCSFQHYSEFNKKMFYHSQFVDEDYLMQIGAFVDFRGSKCICNIRSVVFNVL